MPRCPGNIHRVKRINLNKEYQVYSCMDGCPAYYPLKGLLGKTVRCWNCRDEFVFTKRNLSQAMPRCLKSKCAVPKGKHVEAAIKQKEKVSSAAERILKRLDVVSVLDAVKDSSETEKLAKDEKAANMLIKNLGLSPAEAWERVRNVSPEIED